MISSLSMKILIFSMKILIFSVKNLDDFWYVFKAAQWFIKCIPISHNNSSWAGADRPFLSKIWRNWVEPAQPNHDFFPIISLSRLNSTFSNRTGPRIIKLPQLWKWSPPSFSFHFSVEPAQPIFPKFEFSLASHWTGSGSTHKNVKKVVFGVLSVWTLSGCEWRAAAPELLAAHPNVEVSGWVDTSWLG